MKKLLILVLTAFLLLTCVGCSNAGGNGSTDPIVEGIRRIMPSEAE